MKHGWLDRQMRDADKEIALWPRFMKNELERRRQELEAQQVDLDADAKRHLDENLWELHE